MMGDELKSGAVHLGADLPRETQSELWGQAVAHAHNVLTKMREEGGTPNKHTVMLETDREYARLVSVYKNREIIRETTSALRNLHKDLKMNDEALLCCPCCESNRVEIERDEVVFVGQIYSDRYPADVARQNHGFKVRCDNCGLQTCWWHYKNEAVTFWNIRPT